MAGLSAGGPGGIRPKIPDINALRRNNLSLSINPPVIKGECNLRLSLSSGSAVAVVQHSGQNIKLIFGDKRPLVRDIVRVPGQSSGEYEYFVDGQGSIDDPLKKGIPSFVSIPSHSSNVHAAAITHNGEGVFRIECVQKGIDFIVFMDSAIDEEKKRRILEEGVKKLVEAMSFKNVVGIGDIRNVANPYNKALQVIADIRNAYMSKEDSTIRLPDEVDPNNRSGYYLVEMFLVQHPTAKRDVLVAKFVDADVPKRSWDLLQEMVTRYTREHLIPGSHKK